MFIGAIGKMSCYDDLHNSRRALIISILGGLDTIGNPIYLEQISL